MRNFIWWRILEPALYYTLRAVLLSMLFVLGFIDAPAVRKLRWQLRLEDAGGKR